jgi:hypothetical protein
VKAAAVKQPDKKDNQSHEADNADTAFGVRPGYSRNSVSQIIGVNSGSKTNVN